MPSKTKQAYRVSTGKFTPCIQVASKIMRSMSKEIAENFGGIRQLSTLRDQESDASINNSDSNMSSFSTMDESNILGHEDLTLHEQEVLWPEDPTSPQSKSVGSDDLNSPVQKVL